MAKKEGKKKSPTPCSRYQCATLREKSSGKKQVRGFTNVNSTLRMQHLKKLAIWAGTEAYIPPLGALFGHHLAANAEAMGMPLDLSLFPCQRCETVLQPGYNCTVRIEKNTARVRHRKKSSIPTQNNVVYTCHFCSNRNLKRGTPKGHMKEIFTSKPKSILTSEPIDHIDNKSVSSKKDLTTREKCRNAEDMFLMLKPILEVKFNKSDADLATTEIPTENSPTTPLEKMRGDLSEKKSKSRGPGSNKLVETDYSSATVETGKGIGGSSKRKRKAWSTLKEIAENSELSSTSKVSNFVIPFFMTGSGL